MKDLGQLIITGIGGLTLSAAEKEFIEKEKIGGIILFSKNFSDPIQLKALTDSINSLNVDYPFFICVDHEGGRVIRFKKYFTQFPPMLNLASLNDPEIFYQVGKIMGQELSSCGINLNFSPCCDLFTNSKNQVIGDRAFGSDPQKVDPLIKKFIEGMKKEHVLSCAKHFPGHGDTLEDSHFELPRVTNTLKILKEREFIPFIHAIKSGVDTIMMGHLLVDEIDPKLPCSLSKPAHDILLKELNFKGLIFTDDMQMDAIKKGFSVAKAAELSILAGANCLVYRDLDYAKAALAALKETQISKSLLRETIEKVTEFKKKNLSERAPSQITFKSGEKFILDLKNRLV